MHVRLKCVQVESIEVPSLRRGLSIGHNPRTIGPPGTWAELSGFGTVNLQYRYSYS
jgi:hypothetical protein